MHAVVKKVDLSFEGGLWYRVSVKAAVSTEIGFQQENSLKGSARKTYFAFILGLQYLFK